MLLRPLTLEETVAVSGGELVLEWTSQQITAYSDTPGEYVRWTGGEDVNSNSWVDSDNWEVGTTTPTYGNEWGSQFNFDQWMEEMWRRVIDYWTSYNPGGGGGGGC